MPPSPPLALGLLSFCSAAACSADCTASNVSTVITGVPSILTPSARIFAIAGAYDAMTGERPYRAPLPHGAALSQVASGAHGQFDPALVRAFVLLADELLAEVAGG